MNWGDFPYGANASRVTGKPNTIAAFDENGNLSTDSGMSATALAALSSIFAIKNVSVPNNTTVAIFSVPVASYNFVSYLVKAVVGSNILAQRYEAVISNDGGSENDSFTGPFEIGETGVTFSTSLVGGQITVYATASLGDALVSLNGAAV